MGWARDQDTLIGLEARRLEGVNPPAAEVQMFFVHLRMASLVGLFTLCDNTSLENSRYCTLGYAGTAYRPHPHSVYTWGKRTVLQVSIISGLELGSA